MIFTGKRKIKTIILTLGLLYLLFHLLTLSSFPFAHSDEAWLASLSRTMLQSGDLSATEEFFHITPRYGHAIKILFHILQFPFILISFSLSSVRLFSLLCGLGTIIFMVRIALFFREEGETTFLFLIPALLLGIDIQFIYMSHLARQEICLLLLLVFSLDYFYRSLRQHRFRNDILLGIVPGLAVAIHPNSFIIALPIASLYLFYLITGRRAERFPGIGLKNFFLWLLLILFFALIFLIASKCFEPSFPRHYLEFGAKHGVTDSFLTKLLGLPRFYKKMFYQIGGTYYLPDIRLQLLVFAATIGFSFLTLLIYRKKRRIIGSLLLVILALNLGILIVGKYSPPSIIFIFPPLFLLIGFFLSSIRKKILLTISLLLAAAYVVFTLYATISEIDSWGKVSYKMYLENISRSVPDEVPVLANLNTAFVFSPDQLHVWRDLAALSEAGLTFTEYIRGNNIKYIVYPDEMDVIYQERPVWNDLYGNLYYYYEDMQAFLSEQCCCIAAFPAPVYGMRITQYMFKHPYRIRIFLVGEPE